MPKTSPRKLQMGPTITPINAPVLSLLLEVDEIDDTGTEPVDVPEVRVDGGVVTTDDV
jgi:hypothetical protein